MFSATFPKKVQDLACDILNSSPVKISIGKPVDCQSSAVANEDVNQKVLIFESEQTKLGWLQKNLNSFISNEFQVLIFAN